MINNVSQVFAFTSELLMMKYYALSTLLGLGVSSAVSEPCKCLYGQPCWPSEQEFSVLSQSLSHPLLFPSPPERACYPTSSNSSSSDGSGDCSEVQALYFNGTWRADQVGAMQAPNWESYITANGTVEACPLNATVGSTCWQGSVPHVAVDAYSASDVSEAVKFASKHNLKLVIKNTGHDFLGKSAGHDSFMIWTHHLKNITFNEKDDTLTLGGGADWREAYEAADSHSRFIIGGISPDGSVGAAGGWLMGAGHSMLSPYKGLGVDNVVQFHVVNAAGELVTANESENADLFWALRGGGGGTFGVVVDATYNTHPKFPVSLVEFSGSTGNPNTSKALLLAFMDFHKDLAPLGIGGYNYISTSSMTFGYAAPNMSTESVNATFQPFFDKAFNITSGRSGGLIQEYDSFYAMYKAVFNGTGGGDAQVGANVEVVSRLALKSKVEEEPEPLADFLVSTAATADIPVLWHSVVGGKVSEIPDDEMGLNPVWREATAHVLTGAIWKDGTSAEEIDVKRKKLASIGEGLDRLAGPGAYLNEAFRFDKDTRRVFFGSHYERLLEVKRRHDPKDLFLVPTGVGSEFWDEDVVCLR